MDENRLSPPSTTTIRVHATSVARDGHAVLLRGPSGAGKSDLALRFLAMTSAFPSAAPGQHALVADDRTIITRTDDALAVSCPAAIAGRIEVRGLGIVSCPAIPTAKLVLVVDLVDLTAVERFPEPHSESILGIAVARLSLAPFEPSAPLKLALALDRARMKLLAG
ncbi:MAG TPA: aldolase [Hyphomicrobiaceae bacterium]|nr:aldolase [Hyphomicrobiaceae bacterium]